MNELRITEEHVSLLRDLLAFPDERCAVLLTHEAKRAGDHIAIAFDIVLPEAAEYARSGPLEAELRPDFVARVTKRARSESAGLVFAHTHSGSQPPLFSDIDDFGEERLSTFLQRRIPDVLHCAVVLSKGGLQARELGKREGIRVLSVGFTRDVLYDPQNTSSAATPEYDRQILALGASAQRILGSLRVAIVGLGGTGSIVAQELAHLGATDFLLIDPDILESTNTNRVVDTTSSDVGRHKVDISARYIAKVRPDAKIKRVADDVTISGVARELINTDVIFTCTDSHGSRAVIQQVAYQYLIPCIDMGVVISVQDDRIRHAFGRIQLLAPGLACLTCAGLLNPEEVRRDMMSESERKNDRYIIGGREPAPAVMSLNGTVSSLAVTMFLATFAQLPAFGRHWLYDVLRPRLRAIEVTAQPNCYICSAQGALARSDSWPLFARNV